MAERICHLLFLCTHNSARSILAEAIFNHLSRARLKAFSAGSSPTGKVNPVALRTLRDAGLDTSGLRSKSWNEFMVPGAPEIDIVITVCDDAASEVCPIWPGTPMKVHWGLADPSRIQGDDDILRKAFLETCQELTRRFRHFEDLMNENLNRDTLQMKLNALGRPS